MAQLMPLPLTVSCCSKIQIGFTFLVPAHPGSPGQRAVKPVRVCEDSATRQAIRKKHHRYEGMAPAPLKLRPYGTIQICLLLLLLL